jgi:hypothetical protein
VRRIKLILAAAASMAVLMVLTAAPALADIGFKGGNIGGSGSGDTGSSGGGFTSVGNVGSGEIEIGGTDIGDNDIEFDGVSSLGDSVLLVGNVDDDLDNCEEIVEIGGVLFCADNDNDVEFIGGPGISQEFEQENVVSGDVEPSISIG